MSVARRFAGAVGVCTALAIAIPQARADAPDLMVYAGPSAGSGSQLVPPLASPCRSCAAVGPIDGQSAESPAPMATVAIGLVGTEGYVHGGGELFAILGFGGRETTGYTGGVTYMGMETACWFARAGIGIGMYVGGDRGPDLLDHLAGNADVQLGWRLTGRLSIVGRLDVIQDDTATNPIFGIGLSWTPDRKPPPRWPSPDKIYGPPGIEKQRKRNPLENQPAVRH